MSAPAAICPGCGADVTLPGRVFCRPSCRARHEWRERQAQPSMLLLGDVLDSEWPERETENRQHAHEEETDETRNS